MSCYKKTGKKEWISQIIRNFAGDFQNNNPFNKYTMVKITKEAALEYHESGRPGKIEVKPTKAYRTQTDLSLAYSPGVAYPCLEIQEDPINAYKYTDKGKVFF